MDEEIINKYKEAGKIAKKVIKFATEIIKEGSKAIEIAEKIEEKIIELGGKPAWPVNLSVNSVAAHWTPRINDETIFRKGDVIKVDVGVHIDGYVADIAKTLEIKTKRWKELIRASENALKSAIEIIKPDIPISKIGSVIEENIKNLGFFPIANLSGHGLDRYKTHIPPTIPNFNNKSMQRLKKDTVIAIEPFATNGIGRVIEAKDSEIYRLEEIKPVRQITARKILNYVSNEYKELPFCKRWLIKEIKFGLWSGLNELKKVGAIYNYPVLKEESGGIVSQAEHTILLLDEPIVITI